MAKREARIRVADGKELVEMQKASEWPFWTVFSSFFQVGIKFKWSSFSLSVSRNLNLQTFFQFHRRPDCVDQISDNLYDVYGRGKSRDDGHILDTDGVPHV